MKHCVLLFVLSLLAFAFSCGKSDKTPLPNLFPVSVNGKWGYIDTSGKMKIEPQFDYASSFSEGLALVAMGAGSGEFITLTGEMAGSQGSGYIDERGRLAIDLKFEMAGDFSDGLAVFRENGRYGFINRTGTRCDPAAVSTPLRRLQTVLRRWRWMRGASSGALSTKKDSLRRDRLRRCLRVQRWLCDRPDREESRFVNEFCRSVVPPVYDSALPFSEGLAPVVINGKWAYLDPAGRVRIPPRFTSAGKFSGGLAGVRDAEGWCFVDPNGKTVLRDSKWDAVGLFSEDLAVFLQGEKWGYLDRKGDVVIAPKFDGVSVFKTGSPRFTWVTRSGTSTATANTSGRPPSELRIADCGI